MNNHIYLETYGCQMNLYDTELLISILNSAGYLIVSDFQNADIILLNTCSVREHANQKIINRIYELRRKQKHAQVKIGILGCMATNLKQELFSLAKKQIDFILGPDHYLTLPEILAQNNFHSLEENFANPSDRQDYASIEPTRLSKTNAWLAIMRGCNNFCAYCVVPYTRGRERSRSFEGILTEVQKIIDQGITQITFLGQNVNSYSDNSKNFVDLITAISDLPGIKRIRFMSPHPKDFPVELIEIMASRANICKHIHLPLQSGSTHILQKMNRPYTKETYLDLVKQIRQKMPQVILTTDLIIGFPTETDADFADTVAVFKEVEFDSAFIFKYSERKMTYAAKHFPDDVPPDIKTKRIILLNELQKQNSLKKNQAHIGQKQEILIEAQTTKKSKSEYQGRNDGNKIVIIPKGDYNLNEYVPVIITGATSNVLIGKRL